MKTVRKTVHWSLPVLLILMSVIALVAWSPAEATVDGPVHINKAVLASTMPQPEPAIVEEPAVKVEAPTPENDALVRYLYDAMRTWTSLPSEEKDPADAVRAARNADSRARLASTASDIVTVARDEAPLFEGDTDRSRSAVLVATVAFFESGFAEYVDKGQCNDWRWKHPEEGPDAVPAVEIRRRKALLAAGSCDGGLAFSDWQIHPYSGKWRDGIVLLTDGPRAWAFADDVKGDREVIHGKDMIADRKKAARVAMHMLRQALGHGPSSLCGYTGERGDCPKGAKRLHFAIDWSRKHPFSGT